MNYSINVFKHTLQAQVTTIPHASVTTTPRHSRPTILTQATNASIEEAVAASIDGGDDHGIDSVFIDPTETIWLIQSKYIDSGKGEPALGDVNKFESGVRDLLNQQYSRFNQTLQQKIPALNIAFDTGIAKVKAVLVYTGNALSDDRRRMMGDLENSFNSAGEPNFLHFTNAGLATFDDFQISEIQPNPITAEIELENFGCINQPYVAYYGTVSGQQLKALKEQYGNQLFDANIRQFKGDTLVNRDIAQTIQQEPEHFFYFNNGVTFLCDSFDVIGRRDENRNQGRFRFHGLSVINGAQTVSSLTNATATDGEAPSKILATIVSLDGAPNNFGQHITRYRNHQNAITDIDFAALDENQQQWAQTLQQAGITYRYKGGKADQQDFDVEMAARALACWVREDWSSLVSLAKKNIKRLFDRKLNGEENSSNYSRIFKSSLQARQLWRTVQVVEQVRSQLRWDAHQDSGEQQEILRHCSLLTAHILLIRFDAIDHDELHLSAAHQQTLSEMIGEISTQIVEEYDKLQWNKNPRAVFENSTDLQTLKTAVMTALNRG